MNIQPIIKNTLSYVLIDDFYSKDELDKIYDEIKSLINYKKPPSQTYSGEYLNGENKKQGDGLFLDEFYDHSRDKSDILKFNRKLFSDEVLEGSLKAGAHFFALRTCTRDTTLVNFYSNDGYYKAHTDDTVLTAVTMLKIGNIKGGDFVFSDFNERVEFKENRMVIFPGCVNHEAETTFVNSDDSLRISLAQFLEFRNVY